MVFQTQLPISLVILVIGIQDLYMTNYKYTINFIIISFLFQRHAYIPKFEECLSFLHNLSVSMHE